MPPAKLLDESPGNISQDMNMKADSTTSQILQEDQDQEHEEEQGPPSHMQESDQDQENENENENDRLRPQNDGSKESLQGKSEKGFHQEGSKQKRKASKEDETNDLEEPSSQPNLSSQELKEDKEGGIDDEGSNSLYGSMKGTFSQQKELSEQSLKSDNSDQDIEQQEKLIQLQFAQQKKQLAEELMNKTKLPPSYWSNSEKEVQVLQYVDNFNRQYKQLYPGRKELLLTPENEFGIKKFVSTTLRPTELPFKEMYDYRTCAKFIADYINYESLDPPHELPKKLPSPTYTMSMQCGNCFDCAVLLTSLLIGIGCDAYVVSGYAVREVTLMDETKTRIPIPSFDTSPIPSVITGTAFAPFLATQTGGLTASQQKKPTVQWDKKESSGRGDANGATGEEAAPTAPATPAKYRPKPPRTLKSSFIEKQEQKVKLLEEKRQKDIAQREARRQAALEEEEDELQGLRVHSWVLMLPGKREIAEPFFIEPTTGEIFNCNHSQYLGIESVFNTRNLWVNMQTCFDGVNGISFDLNDTNKWEFILMEHAAGLPKSSQESEDQKSGKASNFDDDEDEENENEVFDLPPSWVDRIVLKPEQFETRCPAGSKTICYKNAMKETFSNYHRKDGMILRWTYFADIHLQKKHIVYEVFENRKDRLKERIRFLDQNERREIFKEGRPHGLREHVICKGKTKEMKFFPEARSDGLILRVEEENKVISYFMDREDRLVYRSVSYESSSDYDDGSIQNTNTIVKMTEKFDRCSDIPAREDIQKKTYFVKEDRIRTVTHLDGNIIPTVWEFRKMTSDQKTNLYDFANVFEVNPFVKTPKKQHLYARLCELTKSEQGCLHSIRNSEREVKEILQARLSEERDITLSVSIYDTIRNQVGVPEEEDKEAHDREEEEAKTASLDYLSPFLVNVGNVQKLTKEEALTVKEACLKSLKERLIEKANIIQSRLDEETSNYQKRQLFYSKNAETMTVEETEEYVRYCNETLFRIQIMEKRLSKHKDTAPEKYLALDRKLRKDPRLTAMLS